MLGFIEAILDIIGLLGIFTSNPICFIIGFVGIIICDFIDIFIVGHNPTTIFFALLLGLFMSLYNHSWLNNFALVLLLENFIMTFITILLITISFFKYKNREN